MQMTESIITLSYGMCTNGGGKEFNPDNINNLSIGKTYKYFFFVMFQ